MELIAIKGSYITLGQLLKKLDLVDSGGNVKGFLQERVVKINQVIEARRGRKLYPQDCIEIEGYGMVEITQ